MMCPLIKPQNFWCFHSGAGRNKLNIRKTFFTPVSTEMCKHKIFICLNILGLHESSLFYISRLVDFYRTVHEKARSVIGCWGSFLYKHRSVSQLALSGGTNITPYLISAESANTGPAFQCKRSPGTTQDRTQKHRPGSAGGTNFIHPKQKQRF